MNLFTSTGYLGYDPEFSYADGLLGQGIDYGKIRNPFYGYRIEDWIVEVKKEYV